MKNCYGILGRGISYTLSPKLHKIIFKKLNIDGSYEIIDSETFRTATVGWCENLDYEERAILNTVERLKKEELKGINVTIPYKERVLKYLDEIDDIAKEIGAVNTIKSQNGKLIGYNTDYYGVIESLKKIGLNIVEKKCYIFGTGGSSRAVYKAIKDLGGIPIFVSRKKKSENIISYDDIRELEDLELGVNCTPENLDLDIGKKFRAVFDLRYKKEIEREKHITDGLYMLVVQGIKSQEIWQDRVIGNYDEIYKEMKGD